MKHLSRTNFLFLSFPLSMLFPNFCFAQKAISFNQAGQYLEVDHHNDLSPAVFTFEFWIRVDELGDPNAAGGEQTIVDKRGNDSGFNIRLAGNAFPLPIFAFYQDEAVGSSDLIRKNIWHFISIVQSETELLIYVDGQLSESTPNSNYRGDSEAPLRIGEFLGYPGAYLGLRGAIDGLRIWNKALTTQDIISGMHQELTGNETDLIASWDFDSKSGNRILNQTKNNHHAEIHGNASLIDSDAPIGFIPPKPLTSVRVIGEKNHLAIEWEPDSLLKSVHIFRSEEANFIPKMSNLITIADGFTGLYLDTLVEENESYYYSTKVENESGHLSQSSSVSVSRMRGDFDDYWTGTYYYPWYGPSQGGHSWNSQYVRDLMVPRQPPLLGHYSSRDTSVIQTHLDWMTAYGIDFLVSSWWGQSSWEDVTLANNMLAEIEETDIQFSVYYESAIHGIENGEIKITENKKAEIIENFNYLAAHYFDHPNYLKVNGRPIVFIYLSAIYTGLYKEAFTQARQELLMKGYDIYLIGDEVGFEAPDPDHMDFLDAISPYILFGLDRHNGYPADTDYFSDLTTAMADWERIAKPTDIKIIPNVFPGFNNRELGGDTYAHPRRTAAHRNTQSTLTDYIRVARPYVDQDLKMIMITSWNEWHEDSQLEPVIVTEPTSMDISSSGMRYTTGYSYEGYGFKPLEVIRNLLTDQSCKLTTNLLFTEQQCSNITDGIARADVRGGVVPVSYRWSNQDTTKQIDGLNPGSYRLTVSDGAGCVHEQLFEIMTLPVPSVTLDSVINLVDDLMGSIYVTATGGTKPYAYSWLFEGSQISIEQTPQIELPGNYSLQITDANGCKTTLDSIEVSTLTASSNIGADQINLFPNPLRNTLFILMEDMPFSPIKLKIIDLQGKIHYWQHVYNKSVDMSNLNSGLYLCEVQINNRLLRRKIIKL